MIALIFASGTLKKNTQLDLLLEQAGLLIAADGGANHCSDLGITPEILVGDLDSIDMAVLASYERGNVEIHRYPVNKNATDLELALDLAISRGASTVWMLGALGGRWDMSLSNIMLGASEKYANSDIRLLGDDFVMHILRPQQIYALKGKAGQTVSLLPLVGDVEEVNLTGFKYPLIDQTIRFGTSLGLSNVHTGDNSTVRFTKGTLLCVQLLSDPA